MNATAVSRSRQRLVRQLRNRTTVAGVLLGMSVLVLFGCASATSATAVQESELSTLEAASQQFHQGFQERFSSTEIPALVSEIYHRDAWFLPPNLLLKRGQLAITQIYQQWFVLNEVKLQLQAMDLQRSGTLASEVGRFRMEIVERESGKTQTDFGKYLIVWKLDGGAWRIYSHSFNSNVPRPSE